MFTEELIDIGNITSKYADLYKNRKEKVSSWMKDMKSGTSGFQTSDCYYIERLFKLLQKLNINTYSKSFADYGCGRGLLCKFLHQQRIFKSVIGYEYSQELVSTKETGANIIHADITTLKHIEDIIYTFQITFSKKREWYGPILKSLRKGQVFIEICDSFGDVMEMAEEFSLNHTSIGDSIAVYRNL